MTHRIHRYDDFVDAYHLDEDDILPSTSENHIARFERLRGVKNAIERELKTMRDGFLSGALPLASDEKEIVFRTRFCLDQERLRRVLGDEFVDQFMTKPAVCVLVCDIEDDE